MPVQILVVDPRCGTCPPAVPPAREEVNDVLQAVVEVGEEPPDVRGVRECRPGPLCEEAPE